METISQHTMERILRTLADQARTRYAGESARIDRGLVIALNGGVTLQANGVALVSSQSHAEIVYAVNGQCDCPDATRAPEGRCKHRWAKTFAKRAMTSSWTIGVMTCPSGHAIQAELEEQEVAQWLHELHSCVLCGLPVTVSCPEMIDTKPAETSKPVKAFYAIFDDANGALTKVNDTLYFLADAGVITTIEADMCHRVIVLGEVALADTQNILDQMRGGFAKIACTRGR